MRKILRSIDAISEWTGNNVSWLAIVLVLLVTAEVIMRYAFNSPTVWGYETVLMIGGSFYALNWSYTQRRNAHVRVDVIYSRLSHRGKTVLDTFLGVLVFVPLIIVWVYGSANWMWHSWATGEQSIESFWYPPLGPFRTAVMVGFILFGLQYSAQLVRDIYMLVRNRKCD